jgi:hypothetical protein
MAKIEEFYDVAKKKSATLCCVKGCRTIRAKRSRLCHGHRMAKWRRENPIVSQFNTLRDSARRRKIDFSLTLAEFSTLCELTNYHEEAGSFCDSLQIDRIDPSKGYSIDNIQVITTSENTAKGNRERARRDYQRSLLKRKGLTDAQIDKIIPKEEVDPFEEFYDRDYDTPLQYSTFVPTENEPF